MTEDDKLGTKNNHFVPQFIQRKYGDRINIFNIESQEYFDNRNPKTIFSEIGLYPNDLENAFNEKMEREAASIFVEKILTAKKNVTLTRKDIQLIKRFFLVGMLRTKDSIELGTFVRQSYPLYKSVLDPEGRYSSELDSEETDEDYWIRTLESILDLQEDFNQNTVYNHPKSTFLAFYWTALVTSGYLGIWDAPEGHEFFITDIGMTSETEKRTNPLIPEYRKLGLLKDLYTFYKKSMAESEQKEMKLKSMDRIIFWQYQFHETFYMFPLSARRMVVLINPFFKEYFASYSLFKKQMPPLDNFTNMKNFRLFSPNQSERMIADDSPRSLDDKYVYHPTRLMSKEIEYCNCLLMDRIHKLIGFGSIDGVYKSILAYEKLPYQRNNYSELFKLAHKYKSDTEHKQH